MPKDQKPKKEDKKEVPKQKITKSWRDWLWPNYIRSSASVSGAGGDESGASCSGASGSQPQGSRSPPSKKLQKEEEEEKPPQLKVNPVIGYPIDNLPSTSRQATLIRSGIIPEEFADVEDIEKMLRPVTKRSLMQLKHGIKHEESDYYDSDESEID